MIARTNTLAKLPLWCTGLLPPLLLLLLMLAAQFWLTNAGTYLAFDRQALNAGEYWRLVSGNFVHTNANHLWLNAAGLSSLWLLHGHYYKPAAFCSVLLLLTLCTGLGLWQFFPEVDYYYGLSGALHGLLVWGALVDIGQRQRLGMVLLGACYLKLSLEFTLGPSSSTAALIASEVAVQSHLLGTLAGTLAGLLALLKIPPFYSQYSTST